MFEQIKENSPKGWKKFFNWCCNKNLIDKYDWISSISEIKFVSLIGHLFTFFDSVGIMINIAVWPNFEDGYTFEAGEIFTGDFAGCVGAEGQFNSRQEAWEAAIPKAFEIYEKILEEK